MKKLILVRHAKTEQLFDYSRSDYDRNLLPRGIEDSKLIATQLKEIGCKPDIYISSSANRAKQTCELFLEYLGPMGTEVFYERFIYEGYTTETMLKYLSGIDNKKESAILFGHNPDIAGFTVNLTSEDLFHFPTGVAVVLKFDVDSWDQIEARQGRVETYLYPSMFKGSN